MTFDDENKEVQDLIKSPPKFFIKALQFQQTNLFSTHHCVAGEVKAISMSRKKRILEFCRKGVASKRDSNANVFLKHKNKEQSTPNMQSFHPYLKGK